MKLVDTAVKLFEFGEFESSVTFIWADLPDRPAASRSPVEPWGCDRPAV